MKKSVLLLFFAGCVATGIFGIGRKIPMNRVNDLGQREGYWRDSLGEGITHELYYKGGKKIAEFSVNINVIVLIIIQVEPLRAKDIWCATKILWLIFGKSGSGNITTSPGI